MIKCIRFFGHVWEMWEISWGTPLKGEDGKLRKQMLQRRQCSECGFNQAEWLPEFIIVEPVADEDKQ